MQIDEAIQVLTALVEQLKNIKAEQEDVHPRACDEVQPWRVFYLDKEYSFSSLKPSITMEAFSEKQGAVYRVDKPHKHHYDGYALVIRLGDD